MSSCWKTAIQKRLNVFFSFLFEIPGSRIQGRDFHGWMRSSMLVFWCVLEWLLMAGDPWKVAGHQSCQEERNFHPPTLHPYPLFLLLQAVRGQISAEKHVF
jgi:hypothetical protein